MPHLHATHLVLVHVLVFTPHFHRWQVALYLQERSMRDFVWGDDHLCGPPRCAEEVEHDRDLAAKVDGEYDNTDLWSPPRRER